MYDAHTLQCEAQHWWVQSDKSDSGVTLDEHNNNTWSWEESDKTLYRSNILSGRYQFSRQVSHEMYFSFDVYVVVITFAKNCVDDYLSKKVHNSFQRTNDSNRRQITPRQRQKALANFMFLLARTQQLSQFPAADVPNSLADSTLNLFCGCRLKVCVAYRKPLSDSFWASSLFANYRLQYLQKL